MEFGVQQAILTGTTQDSLPAGGPLPWPVGLSPMGRDRKFQLATSAFPFSKLLLAQPEIHRTGHAASRW